MFAPTMHPAMRHVGPARREMAIETLMNLVGPLANPGGRGAPGDRRRVAGAARNRSLVRSQRLGTTHSLVVHGEPGMDEISPIGLTTVIELRGASVTRWTLDPADYGLSRDEARGARGRRAMRITRR